MMKRVAIIGIVGVPARYGGFETLVENLIGTGSGDIAYTVYCSSRSYTAPRLRHYKNAHLRYIPLQANGIQSIPYDIISILRACRNSDTLLILGVSGCLILPWIKPFIRNKKLIVNIDGLEHRRDKWKPWIRKFLKWSEKIAVRYADTIIADNRAIQDYLRCQYGVGSTLIAYGGDHVLHPTNDPTDVQIPDQPYSFGLCRIEPENNVHIILEAFACSKQRLTFVGNWDNSEYGRQLKRKYGSLPNMILVDPIYDLSVLNLWRNNCVYYIHGHSAGGTNPSLVEAMFFGKPIIAYDVPYNRETTEDQALYFCGATELSQILENSDTECLMNKIGQAMLSIATRRYRWETIKQQYESIY